MLFDIVQGNNGIIKTPYKDINVKIDYAFKHFTQNTYKINRDNIKGGFFETFRKPLFVVEQQRENATNPSIYFYKPFYDKNKKLLNLLGIGIKDNREIEFKTYYLDNKAKRLRNILKDESIEIKYLSK